MPRIFTLSQYTSLRRKLRQQPTRAEAALWFQLRDKKFLGYKFRRQHSIGRYVLDFFCAKLMLGIEVDGATHLDPAKKEYDKIRQAWIEDRGVRIIRFTDSEILADTDATLNKLRRCINSSPGPSSARRGAPPLTPPHRGGEPTPSTTLERTSKISTRHFVYKHG